MVNKVDLDRGVNTKGAAELLGVRPPALQRAVWDGRIEAPEKFGRSYIWRRQQLEQAAWALHRKPLDELLARVENTRGQVRVGRREAILSDIVSDEKLDAGVPCHD